MDNFTLEHTTYSSGVNPVDSGQKLKEMCTIVSEEEQHKRLLNQQQPPGNGVNPVDSGQELKEMCTIVSEEEQHKRLLNQQQPPGNGVNPVDSGQELKEMCKLVGKDENPFGKSGASIPSPQPDDVPQDSVPLTQSLGSQIGCMPVLPTNTTSQNSSGRHNFSFNPIKAAEMVDNLIRSHQPDGLSSFHHNGQPDFKIGSPITHEDPFSVNQAPMHRAPMNQVPMYPPMMPPNFTVPSVSMIQEDGEVPFNATVEIVKTVICDSEADSFYWTQVNCGGALHTINVPITSFTNGQWLNGIPGFCTNLDKAKTNKYLFRYLNHLVSIQGQRCVEHLVEKPGFYRMKDTQQYATPNGAIGNSLNSAVKSKVGQSFGDVTDRQCGNLKSFLGLTSLTPTSWITAIILLYDVLSFAWQLFFDAGWMVKFLLLLKGATGTFKTSISKVLTQVEDVKLSEFHLSSTGAGLESGYAKYRHSVFFVDDFAPSTNQRSMTKAAENLIRAFGDGTGRQRDVSDAKERFRHAEGGCLITAEINPFEGSSLVRLIQLPIKAGDVDSSVYYTIKDQRLVASFMYGFIQYLSMRYEELVAFIRDQGEWYRESLMTTKYSHSRYREYHIQLLTAKDLLLRFGQVTGQLTEKEYYHWDSIFTGQIRDAIDYNSRLNKDQSPAELVCSAIAHAIECNRVVIVPLGTIVSADKRTILDGNDTYYLQQGILADLVKEYRKDNGLDSGTSKSPTLAAALVSAGVAPLFQEGNQERKSQKLPGYGSTRYMALNKTQLFERAAYEPAE